MVYIPNFLGLAAWEYGRTALRVMLDICRIFASQWMQDVIVV
jgi:hypothetical protein